MPTQAAQIQNLILQGYNAIVINAASPDALNGAVKQACDAGIVVVSFDGIVTEPCAYRIVVDFKGLGEAQVDFLAKQMPKGGNLLEIRGMAGTSIDDAIHNGIVEGVKKNPQFKIVNAVEGDWDQTTAQKAVATVVPSLPRSSASSIRAGTAMAPRRPSRRRAGRSRPSSWATARTNSSGGRSRRPPTATRPGRPRSRRASPSMAFWVAQQVLDGRKDIPHDLTVPYLAFTQDNFEAALPKIPVGGVASAEYSLADAQKAIDANLKK